MKSIIIRGYYGRDNLGDEIMKDIFIRELSKENIKLYIMNSSPLDMKKMYNIDTPKELITGEKPKMLMFLKRILTVIKADLYIYGGGTILTDKHSYMHLVENNIYFILRKILGKENLMISVGATKFKTKIGMFLCRTLIKNSTETYVRDEDSYELLKKMTNNSRKMVLSSDMVLLYNDYIRKRKKKKNMVGLCLMPYYCATYHDSKKDEILKKQLIDQILKIYKDNPELKFSLIPIQYGENDETDFIFCKEIYNELSGKIPIKLFKEKNISEKCKLLQMCEYIISMRLHALMIAKMSNAKIFAIDHNEKITYFMKHYDNSKNTINIDKVFYLSQKFNKIRNEKPHLKQNIDKDYITAKENINVIKKYIGGR